MRPGSIDEVLAAYHQAQASRRDIEDQLRIAVGVVARLTSERDEKTQLVRELREEVKAFTMEVAA